MTYTSGVYQVLCDEADAWGDVVKLSRAATGWGLQLIATPRGNDSCWRAAGIVFPALSELDEHAQHLLAWLRTQPERSRCR